MSYNTGIYNQEGQIMHCSLYQIIVPLLNTPLYSDSKEHGSVLKIRTIGNGHL